MNTAKEFFRHCPSCGRKFHIKLVSKKLVDKKKETEIIKQPRMSLPMRGISMAGAIPIILENHAITVDVEDFQYYYKCKHCGHEWIETRTNVEKV